MPRFVKILLSLAIVGVLLSCAGFFLPLDLAIALTFGWIWYLGRVVPEVSVDWGAVAFSLAGLALFAAGLHPFLRWLDAQIRAEDRVGPTWPVRGTLALVAMVALMFAAGIAATGVAHQSGWLLASHEPWTDRGRQAMSRAMSTNNLRQIGLGFHNYAGDRSDVEGDGTLPPGGTFDAYGRMQHSWMTSLLPHIDQAALYNSINLALPWDDPRNAVPFQEVVLPYQHPAIVRRSRDPIRSGQRTAEGRAAAHYAGNARVIGGSSPIAFRGISDGTSTTILAGEVIEGFKPWGYPANWRDPARGINRVSDGFGGPSPGGINVLFADGSVHFLKNTINATILKALSTPAGGETVRPEDY